MYRDFAGATLDVVDGAEEEQDLLERDIEEVFNHFVESVARARNMDVALVRTLADGSTMTGSRALDVGLVDTICGIEEARRYVEEKIGENDVLCDSECLLTF